MEVLMKQEFLDMSIDDLLRLSDYSAGNDGIYLEWLVDGLENCGDVESVLICVPYDFDLIYDYTEKCDSDFLYDLEQELNYGLGDFADTFRALNQDCHYRLAYTMCRNFIDQYEREKAIHKIEYPGSPEALEDFDSLIDGCDFV